MHSTTLATFQLAVMVCLAIVPFVSAATPSIVNSAGGFSVVGCQNVDSVNGLALANQEPSDSALTVEKCATTCGGFQFAGLTQETLCFCGNTLTPTVNQDESLCQGPCGGNPNEACGDSTGLFLLVYKSG